MFSNYYCLNSNCVFLLEVKIYIPDDENLMFSKYRCIGKEIKMKIRSFVIFWLSRIIFNSFSPENKATFRKLEDFEKKEISNQLHCKFNQIYICTYIYTYKQLMAPV